MAQWYSDRSSCDWSLDPLSYFSIQPLIHNWCNKGSCMCYPVYGMVILKGSLLLIGVGSFGFPLSLPKWYSKISPALYNRQSIMFSTCLNKTFSSGYRMHIAQY